MNIHIIMHESFEAPGAIRTWGENKKHKITYTHLYQKEVLPLNTKAIDFLIIMGGPQSPATTKEQCLYFDSEKEIKFIKKIIEQGKLVLGICLGAQLIGEALGAKYDHSPNKEIGVFELNLTADAKNDPLFSTFPQKFLVGHWHGDMPGLTPEAKILATNKGCPRQIVRYTPKVYGFQCHFEFTKESIEKMITHCSHELEEGKNLLFVQSKDELRKNNYSSFNKLLFEFLDYMENTFSAV